MIQPPRPFRFGLQNSRSTSLAAWQETARRAEASGYDILTIADHFGDQLAYAPALTAAALATTTLRIGTMVIDNDFRHPALVAADAATLDLLSEGRFELGLGAGWLAEDYTRTGIPFDRPGVRVDRLIESVRIIKGLLAGQTVTQAGRHYTIADLPGYSGAVQRPHPPIVIGAGGKRMLTFAAQEADIVSVLPQALRQGGVAFSELAAGSMAEKVAFLRGVPAERTAPPEIHMAVQTVAVTNNWHSLVGEIGQRLQLPPDEVRESPAVLLGTVDELVETLLLRRERFGLSYLTIREPHLAEFAPVMARLAGK